MGGGVRAELRESGEGCEWKNSFHHYPHLLSSYHTTHLIIEHSASVKVRIEEGGRGVRAELRESGEGYEWKNSFHHYPH